MKYYTIKGLRCPCACGGEGEVSFVVCLSCNFLLKKCEEIDTLMDFDLKEIVFCPRCGERYFCQFPHAEIAKIEDAGQAISELEAWDSYE